MPNAFIIIPIHNRKDTTIRCLGELASQKNLDGFQIVVIDDGSTDGTAEAILTQYPQVTLITGDGNLWWTGAIAAGMKHAIDRGADWIIWLNDDCLPCKGSINLLISYCQDNPKTIAAANVLDPDTFQPSYGGIKTQKLSIQAAFASQRVTADFDGLNGNLICLPKSVIDCVGYPDPSKYPHYHGDTIYTHLASKKGYSLVILKDAVAYCKNDNELISWFFSQQSLFEVLKDRTRIKSAHYWKASLYYYVTLLGAAGLVTYIYDLWIKMLAIMAIKVFVPDLPTRLKGGKQI